MEEASDGAGLPWRLQHRAKPIQQACELVRDDLGNGGVVGWKRWNSCGSGHGDRGGVAEAVRARGWLQRRARGCWWLR